MSSTFQKILAIVGLVFTALRLISAARPYLAVVDTVLASVVGVALSLSALGGKLGSIARAIVTDAQAVQSALAGASAEAAKKAAAGLLLLGLVSGATVSMEGCSAAQKNAENAAAAKVFACLSSHASDFLTAGDPLAIVEKYAADCGETDVEAAIAFFESLAHPAAASQGAKARASLAAKRATASR